MNNEEPCIGSELSDSFFEAAVQEDQKMWRNGLPFRDDADWLYMYCAM